MRSLFAKLFLCMLLVPALARGGGLLLSATLGDNRPEAERVLGAALPLYAEALGAAMDRDGPAVANAMAAAMQSQARLQVVLRPPVPGVEGCASPAPAAAARGRSLAVPVPTRLHGPACLAVTMPPRARLLGVFPGSWWTLLPLVELATCAVVSFFLARYLARPIQRIRAAAAAFAAGDLSARGAPPTPGPPPPPTGWPPACRPSSDSAVT